ncbi:PEP-CTERM system histidine kinase PrsK [Kinneretia asaccharophila]|uniref:histidine kinase n=1 Tax=Roseateles asaccharophilus TaxID=582607 RepID=A0A4R6NA28_9BURK|nr:XrtA/PEP-CTERM system histidine kinase PrsK [Roseateles asaccharophilus]MDN3543505.1 PEP-CTERM system histidine kinase PrsK [Roseateles asaccharophilus]TDP12117.1 putative PEP-CTERM system histidine kinase [Roseateles asaccharophilus]
MEGALDLSALFFGLAGLAYGAALLFHLIRLPKRRQAATGLDWIFGLALGFSAAWAVLGAWVARNGAELAPAFLPALLDGLRYGFWFVFLISLMRASGGAAWSQALRCLSGSAALLCAATLISVWLREYGAEPYSSWDRPLAYLGLGQALMGLVLLEQLLRSSQGDSRWGVKPVGLALGAVFVFDLYAYSQAALFQQIDGDVFKVRPLVHTLAVPLLFMAMLRHGDWLSKLHVSRVAAFHSATLLIAGAYLMLISAVGYYVRYTGGGWGRAMQIAVIFVALVGFATVAMSGAMRAKLRVYINKHFFSYRYDYREEWLRFTAMLSSQSSPQALGVSVIRGIANLVESPSGGLWLRQAGDGEYRQVAVWNRPVQTEVETADSSLLRFLRERAWIVDLDEYRQAPQRYEGLSLPNWALADSACWLLVPLVVGTELTGFVQLGHPRTRMDLDWEVRDLLRTASSQASSYLAQMQATEALLDARKFEAFNRMSAFVVHDLKNIVTQLSLMMKNAKRLRDNPEFQEDMLATVENSLEKMRQLMLQLREGEAPHGGGSGVELQPIVERLAAAALRKGRELHLEVRAGASTRGHEQRVERVIGHVVQNAFDATPEDGEVRLVLDVEGSNARIEVSDTGCGMSEDFIRTRLFRPFQTTKTSGMGIGAYESFQYLQELGGKITVDSQVGHGTRITISLPLLRASKQSDLGMLSAK